MFSGFDAVGCKRTLHVAGRGDCFIAPIVSVQLVDVLGDEISFDAGPGVLGTSERKVRLSHRQRLLRRCTSYSWSAIGLRNGRSSPRATVSGIANEYRPNMLMWSWISGESLATSASETWYPS